MIKNNRFFRYLNSSIILSIILSLYCGITDGKDHQKAIAFSQRITKFALCNDDQCDESDYYVGYKRTNKVSLLEERVDLPLQFDLIFLNTADMNLRSPLPNIDERLIDLEDGNFVSSLHRIDNAQIGFLRKSELINVHTLLNNSWGEASIKLFWGDRLRVTSSTLAIGTPINLIIERNMGGFGGPVTDNAYYKANAQTFIDGKSVADLDFALQKKPGKDQGDEMSGEGDATYFLNLRVGDTVTIESLLEVVDGVKGDSTTHQMLNGADSVEHKITISDQHDEIVCLQSASGKFNSGNCL
jgi:hypothetical protein